MFSALWDILFPPRCLACEDYLERGFLCSACRDRIPLRDAWHCGHCGARLPLGRPICHPDFPFLAGSATDYDEPGVKEMIWALKFRNCRGVSLHLADLLHRYLNRAPSLLLPGALWLPMPLSRRRLAERGFNQAELVARALTELRPLELRTDVFSRTRHTAAQSDLPLAERERNVADCFSVLEPDAVRGRHICILDDVLTSGATMAAAAKALRAAGAKRILGLAVARA